MRALSERLACVAAFVRRGSKVADIGTDHAYLPVYLVQKGICPCAVAADLRSGPLANARQAVEDADLTDKIQLRLSDGLEKLEPDEVDDVVIAGMGGILIAQLLENAPWLKNEAKHLVLQPMSHPEQLRLFLMENGYEILQEDICRDSGKTYCVISAAYSAQKTDYEPHYEYYGEIPACKTALAEEYLSTLAKRLKRDSASMSAAQPQKAAQLRQTAEKIEALL